MQNPAGPPIEAVDRALQLLVLLRDQGRVSVTAAADHLGVAPSTAHRVLSALCYRDFAVQDRDRQYRAGPQLADAIAPDLSLPALRRIVRPGLEALHDELQETTHLVVLAGTEVRFVDGVEGEQALRVGVRTGVRMPAYVSSGGKAILAALPRAEVDHLYRRGLPHWPAAQVSDLAGLHRQLDTVRKRGYGVNIEESEPGVVAVGRCLRDIAGKPVAAISVSIPSVRFRRSDLDRYATATLAAADSSERRLAAGQRAT